MSPPTTPKPSLQRVLQRALKRPVFATTAMSGVLLWGAASAALAQAPLVAGEVVRINTAVQKITLKHGEIPNLDMPPMTMVFAVQQPSDLAALQPGDRVRFSAEKVGGQYTVTTLQALTADAPAASTVSPEAPEVPAGDTARGSAIGSGAAATHRH